MKNLVKIFLGIGVLAVASVVIVKLVKDEKKKLEKEKKTIDEGLSDIGLSRNQIEEEINSGDEEKRKRMKNDFIYSLYYTVEHGSDNGELFDRDLVKIHSDEKNGRSVGNGVMDSENVIHVISDKSQDNKEMLKFCFEIPGHVYTDGVSYRYPKIGDYIRVIKDAANYAAVNIIKFTPKPICELVGYYVISYRACKEGEKDIIRQRQIRIPRKDYANISAGRDGEKLFEYVKEVNKGLTSGTGSVIQVGFYDSEVEKNGETVKDLRVVSILLLYEVSYPILKKKDNDSNSSIVGIDISLAMKTLRYFVEEVSISRGSENNYYKDRNNVSVTYDHLLFHAKNYDCLEGEEYSDWLMYYTVDIDDERDPKFSKREIIAEKMIYD